MKRYYCLKRWVLLLLLSVTILDVFGQGGIKGRIQSIKNADPFAISGTVGTAVGLSYNSNYPSCTPFSGSVYASLNLSFYSFQLPFSFYFANNTTSFDYPQLPTWHLGFMPTWRNWKFHIGSSSMHFSNYTYSGLTFLGLGAEYQGKLFRMGAFGGLLQQATRMKGYDDRSAIQQLADSLLGLNVPQSTLPQYRREAVGAKIGVGNSRNFIDISFLKAKDRIKTLPEEWRDTIPPQDNFTLGLSGRFAIGRWFAFTANVGASLHNPDLRDSIHIEGYQKYERYFNWLFTPGNSFRVRFAGDAAMNFMFKHFNGSLTYRFIQPDYVSLGAQNFNQNAHSLGAVMNFNMFKGRSNLGLVGYLQRDNMNHKQMFTDQVATYSLNWHNSIGNLFNMGILYSGIKQDQYDGSSVVVDSLRINSIVHTISLSPTFTIERANIHSIGLTANLVQNKNLNKLNHNGMDVQTLTIGASYGIDLSDIRLSIHTGYDFSMSSSRFAHYNSHGLNFGLNYRIMQREKLNWTISYNGFAAYNIQKDEGAKNDFSLSNSLGSSFSYKKHAASLYLSLSNFSDMERIGQRVHTNLDTRFTFSYSYTFAARVIKKKTKEQRAADRVERAAKKLDKQQHIDKP
ncbi:MAG: hypothetical protein J5741_01850 [Bacteroidales bacterium]|nr:hypothetical protein [Bacteroidales bacterium]